MRTLQRFVEVHADFDQTKESPDMVRAEFNQGSCTSQSKLDRNSNED